MLRKLFLILVLLSSTVYAGQKAVTDTGKIVILNDNGTWVYEDDQLNKKETIGTNQAIFEKSPDADFQFKSKRNNSAFWINTNKWKITQMIKNDSAEYIFKRENADLYALVIAEGFAMPMETLANAAFNNMKEQDANATISGKEYRIVNGNKVIYMVYGGTVNGIPVSYYGYFSTNDSGCTQFIVFTSTNLGEKHESEIQEFLNGLTVQ